MRQLSRTGKFNRDLKRAVRRGRDMQRFEIVVDRLLADVPLSPSNRLHKLSGDYQGFWECHLAPDWLLIFELNEEEDVLTLVRTGSHSDLFG